jgi:3-dehydroquinate synthase
MHAIKVRLKERSYDIVIGSTILDKLSGYANRLDLGTDAYIITNASLKKRFGSRLTRSLKAGGLKCRVKIVADSESAKDIQTVACVIRDLAKFDLKRRPFIIALGGGVVGDLSGFIASVYKRGIPYVQVPTTLLAQVDSSIGGKTAVDLSEGKNLVGAFYQPKLVFTDVALLKSLDKRQVSSGLAEVIKYGIIKDKKLFSYLEKKYREALDLEEGALLYIVKSCAKVKADIVSSDEREKRQLRTCLNFGHTIGHAIEAASGYKGYNHGEAVALGMLAALGISVKLGLADSCLLERARALIKNVGLPSKLKGVSPAKILSRHYHDKKFSGKSNKFVLVSGLGKVKIVKDVPLGVIRQSVRDLY